MSVAETCLPESLLLAPTSICVSVSLSRSIAVKAIMVSVLPRPMGSAMIPP